ncbi:MAG: hypothetical protein LQ351_006966 [Letrouitia transgressa]|nr:MAG: hypothetical protein LQ351_006966 [Letrouitia transgressa]
MAMSNRRSTSNVNSKPEVLEEHHQPQLYDNEKYKSMVLRFDQGTTEEEVDRHFLQTALNLGINVPQDPKTTLDLVTGSVSALDISSIAPESQPPPSRTSNSTHPASCSSSEQRGHTKTSSVTSSLTSAQSSVDSWSSRKSSFTKFKKGFRRLSTLRRRRTIDTPVPPLPISVVAIKPERPPHPGRPATTDQFPMISLPLKPIAPPRPPPPPPLDGIGSNQHVYISAKDREDEDSAARRRSMHHPRLKGLRLNVLEEQNRFLRFEADQYRLLHFKQADTKRAALEEYRRKEKAAQDRHAEALMSLEHRHLSAEVDLQRTLESERQACETRLKHMQAFCNPRSTVDGMPDRVITKQHYRQLEQQYHLRNGMDNLHKSRINVLREKQGKQLERIYAKQENELHELEDELSRRHAELDASFELEERLLRREFAERKKRLINRWNLAEAIERRKLENETGDMYGRLSDVVWEEGNSTDEEGDRGGKDDFTRDAIMAYDAATMNMI